MIIVRTIVADTGSSRVLAEPSLIGEAIFPSKTGGAWTSVMNSPQGEFSAEIDALCTAP